MIHTFIFVTSNINLSHLEPLKVGPQGLSCWEDIYSQPDPT